MSTILQDKATKRLSITIPKVISDARGFKAGTTIEWLVNDWGDLVIRKVKIQKRAKRPKA